MSKSFLTTKITLALGLILAMIFGMAPSGAFAAVVRSTYIVQVQEGHATDVRDAIGRLGETPHDELTEVMDGFVIDLTDTEVAALRAEPYVVQVTADAPMQLMDTQSPVPSWGLDRIDQNATAGDGAYNYPSTGGAGVRIYVVDTGVMASNPDFAGRMLPGIDMLGQNLEANDCQGHGTHVAGTAAGTKYGVAKKAWIVPIRVLGCNGSGSFSYLISAMDWIIANNPAGTPAVMSASIGGPNYPLANAAMEKLYAAGITPIIAAGNSNIDACGTSPAGATNAITVGASDINDNRASYSNWGECVDVFAPGSGIISDSNTDPTAGVSKSGTSMATPHVSGLAALYLAANPKASPAAVTSAIKAGGLAGAVANAQSTLGNILINNGFTRASVPVTPAPVNSPTNVVASAITSTSANIAWTAPVVDPAVASTAPESYKVEYKLTTATAWSTVTSATTSVTLTGLTSLSNYSVRVTSVAGTLTSAPSTELQFSTLGTAPDAPTNLIATAIYGNQINLAWTAPNSNGASITAYYLEQQVNGVWTRIATAYGKSWIVSKLTPVTSYSFRIQAYNTLGVGPYSSVLTVSTTNATPATPTGIVISNIAATSVTASWVASPSVETGVAITYQVNIYSRQVYNFGAVLGSYVATSNTFVVPNLIRSTSYSIRIKAISGAAMSPQSALTVFTTAKSKPLAPSSATTTRSATAVTITWAASRDDGGSAVTGYLVDKKNADGTWTNIANQTSMSLAVAIPARATSEYYRISAVNAIGVGDPLAVTVSTQAAVPTAPQALTITRNGTNSTLAWTAPIDDGGAPVVNYQILRSSDNGATWIGVILGAITTSFTLPAAPKGVKFLYVVTARNSTGIGARSESVVDETLTTVPSAVRSISFGYPTADKLQIGWTTPGDNGGLAISAYRLERQAADGTWSILNESSALSFQIARDLPGVLVNIRVTAINALGAGPALAGTWRTPYAKASAPQNFAAVDDGSRVNATWAAPANLGGATLTSYQLQVSRDGNVWSVFAYLNQSATAASVPRPTKGQTWIYRIVAFTAFGASEFSNAISITAPVTVPGNPLARSISLNSEGNLTVTWNLPYDNGGRPVTAILLERSNDNLTWIALPPLAANATFAVIPSGGAGDKNYLRARAVNAVGNSNPSSVLYLQVPYQKAGAPTALSVQLVSGRTQLSWTAPVFTGGSAISNYYVEYSPNGGANWYGAVYVNAPATSALVNAPGKGQTFAYRVSARTLAGNGAVSESVTVSTPTTISSSVRLSSLIRTGVGTFRATFSQPGDLGGYPTYNYRVEVSLNGVWTQIASGTGAALTSVDLTAPNTTAYFSYRIIASNPMGDSPAYAFNFKG